MVLLISCYTIAIDESAVLPRLTAEPATDRWSFLEVLGTKIEHQAPELISN